MANGRHVRIVRKGADAIRNWRRRNPTHRLSLSRSNLIGTDLKHADLRSADFTHADLRDADLRYANLSGALLGSTDLRNANLTSANLDDAQIIGANLSRANLRAARINYARLVSVNLCEADLSYTKLSGSWFHHVSLRKANLEGSDLLATTLQSADLRGASLATAHLSEVGLLSIDLSQTLGLEDCEHLGPSTIGIDTLSRSKGNIPEVFLEGCGVPEEMISFARSISGAIQFYSCFISYTEADDAFSKRLYNDLRGEKVRCWRWREDAKWGARAIADIDNQVRLYDKLVVICSRASLNARPVINEIELALEKEGQTSKPVLFPITIDDYVFSWKDPLRTRIKRNWIADFREWGDPKKYQAALTRLVVSLSKNERDLEDSFN